MFLLVTVTGSCTGLERAQMEVATDEARGNPVTVWDYRRAEQLLSWNLQSKVLGSNIRPEWIDDDRFWYRVRTVDGYRFFRVNPDETEKIAAFDQEKLAQSLAKVLDKRISAWQLPFSTFRYAKDELAIRFVADDIKWECDLVQYECLEADASARPDNSVLSPDKKWAAYIRDHNLRVRNLESGEDVALTKSGTERHGFATNSQGWFRSDTPVLHWSPDSRKIATYQLDEREVKEMHLLETARDRPIIDSWPYALPGDAAVPMLERVVLDIDTRRKIRLDVEPSHQRTSNCCGLERGDYWADIDWSDDASQMAFVTTSRDYREVNLYVADTETGDVRHIYRETAETFFESNLTSRGIPNWRVLFERDQFIWFTRQDEWGHLYLHDLNDGSLVHRITEGEWNVVDLLHIDDKGGDVWFTAAGKIPNQDPYLTQLYKACLNTGFGCGMDDGGVRDGDSNRVCGNDRDGDSDGGRGRDVGFFQPKHLTPEVANHQIHISPSGRFFTDEYSTFRHPSETVLRNADGEIVMSMETADISNLNETAWSAPEPFTVKARDGETDLYGILILPSGFDPEKSWPVVVSIYPGPQIGSVGTRSFSVSRRGQAHALAELGFVVVMIDALGTPLRSKSFHTAWYGNMIDNGIEDQITGLQQLAERYDWIDIDRAGIYGHSGGGYATASALLRFPGVFRAGVASAGNMDNRGYTYYWGEKYQGPRKEEDGKDTFTRQAVHRLAGRLEDQLLLSYGTMDSNVHPNMTLLLIDELIKENKNFDLVVMPNRGHGYGNESYHIRRTWDFFVRHLLETDPPREYRIQ